MGEATGSWGVESSNVPVRLHGLSGKETIEGKQVVNASHLVFCKCDIDPDATKRWVIDGRTLQINYVNKEPGGVSDHHYECLCEEIRT